MPAISSSSQALAQRVAELSQVYTRERGELLQAPRSGAALEARLRFFLRRDQAIMQRILGELERFAGLPTGESWRVLDLGAGVGAMSVGTALFAKAGGRAKALHIDALDIDARALGCMPPLLARLAEEIALPITLRIHPGDLRQGALPGGAAAYDLILVSFVLNELNAAKPSLESSLQRLEHWGRSLAPGGSLIVIEPALREPTRALHRLRDALLATGSSLRVAAPCLHDAPCPMLRSERDWCHEEYGVEAPKELQALAQKAGLRADRIRYSYLVLRHDGRNLREALSPLPGTPLRMVSTRRVSKGKIELWGCGSPGSLRLSRLDRHRSEENAAFDALQRGRLFTVEPALSAPSENQGLRIGPESRIHLASADEGNSGGDE